MARSRYQQVGDLRRLACLEGADEVPAPCSTPVSTSAAVGAARQPTGCSVGRQSRSPAGCRCGRRRSSPFCGVGRRGRRARAPLRAGPDRSATDQPPSSTRSIRSTARPCVRTRLHAWQNPSNRASSHPGFARSRLAVVGLPSGPPSRTPRPKAMTTSATGTPFSTYRRSLVAPIEDLAGQWHVGALLRRRHGRLIEQDEGLEAREARGKDHVAAATCPETSSQVLGASSSSRSATTDSPVATKRESNPAVPRLGHASSPLGRVRGWVRRGGARARFRGSNHDLRSVRHSTAPAYT